MKIGIVTDNNNVSFLNPNLVGCFADIFSKIIYRHILYQQIVRTILFTCGDSSFIFNNMPIVSEPSNVCLWIGMNMARYLKVMP